MTATKRVRDEDQKQILTPGVDRSFLRYGSLSFCGLHGHTSKG